MNTYINIPEYNVSQFNKLFKDVIESNFDYVRIKGEISEIKTATRGQIYLTLKDNQSILSGVIWDSKKKFLKFNIETGMEVILTGKITTWSKFKTTYQIDIDKVELSGEGALLKLIEDRKKKLKALGIFDEKNKKKLPYLPKKIGVITSPTGSVIHDIINRIKERFPLYIDVWPVAVQGTEAVELIIKAIKGFNDNSYELKPDILIIARGGGSAEDLMTFNDENLVMAVFDSEIPIISAIGHETDTTIIDYVSDLRASTPTAAAEKAVPIRVELEKNIIRITQRLNFLISNKLNTVKYNFSYSSKLLKAPYFIIKIFDEKFQYVASSLNKKIKNLMETKYSKLENCYQYLRSPKHNLDFKKGNLQNLIKNFERIINDKVLFKKKDLNKYKRLLESNSISSSLNKGFSIVRKSNKIIKNSSSINSQDSIKIQFSDKSVNLKIKKFS